MFIKCAFRHAYSTLAHMFNNVLTISPGICICNKILNLTFSSFRSSRTFRRLFFSNVSSLSCESMIKTWIVYNWTFAEETLSLFTSMSIQHVQLNIFQCHQSSLYINEYIPFNFIRQSIQHYSLCALIKWIRVDAYRARFRNSVLKFFIFLLEFCSIIFLYNKIISSTVKLTADLERGSGKRTYLIVTNNLLYHLL